jgi:hypothetical protein
MSTAPERASRPGGGGKEKEDVMSTNRIRPASAAAAGTTPDPGATPSPTVTHYQQVAEQFLKALEDVIAIMPKQLEAPHPETAKWVRTHLNFPDKFLVLAVTAVDQVPALQGVGKLDVNAARDTLQFNEAFAPARIKVEAFVKALEFTMASGKASLTADALQTYSILKAIVRDPGSAHVIPIVDEMKRTLIRRKPKPPAAAEVPMAA